MLNKDFGMVRMRTPIVKGLFPVMRRSMPVPKLSNKGHRYRASLGIRLQSQRAEIHKYARLVFTRSCCCSDVNERKRGSRLCRNAGHGGVALLIGGTRKCADYLTAETGYLRPQIIGNPNAVPPSPALIPVGKPRLFHRCRYRFLSVSRRGELGLKSGVCENTRGTYCGAAG